MLLQFKYQKYRGTKLLWTRNVAGYSKLNLQQTTHKVYQRYTSKDDINIQVSGGLTLQRMQGLASPTYENGAKFNLKNGGYQVDGNTSISRTTTDAGKYSIIFGVNRIYDEQEGASIPVITDPTTPRFQCYASSQRKNCDFPGGHEAGVF